MKNIGLEIKNILDKKGLKRRDLAHHLDMTEANVSKIYNKSSIDVSLLERIAQFIDTPITYFFEESETAGHHVRVDGDQNTTVTGNGKFFSGRKVPKGHANGGGEDSSINEKVKILEQLLSEKDRVIEEKDRMIEQKEKLIEEKERLIKVLMEKR